MKNDTKIEPAASGAGDELPAQVTDELPPLPHTTYNGYADGSEPLYTADQMREYARLSRAQHAQIGKSLLRAPISATNPLPTGCYCNPGQCAAPVIMGRQTPCRDPSKRDAAPSTQPQGGGK